MEVPPEGFPEVISEPDETGMRSVSYRVPWQDVTLAVMRGRIVPKTLDNWFADCIHLREIRGLGLLDTSCVRSMRGTFFGCETLVTLDVSGFETSRVEDMGNLFWGCSRLVQLDVSGFDTRRVEWMSGMFWGCSSLRALDLSGFDLSSITTLSLMFRECSSLASLRMPGIDSTRTDQVRMGSMFVGADALGVAPEHLMELIKQGVGISVGMF